MTVLQQPIIDIAVCRLVAANAYGVGCYPIRELIGTEDFEAAYAVQRRLVATRVALGGRIVGRKVGATSVAVQQQLGVAQPDLGVLFADMDVSDCEVVPMGRLIQPRVEAEVAFVLAEDLTGEDLTPARVRAAVDHVVAALEIVDSRISGWDIRFTDTVADNASTGLFVLGGSARNLEDFEPRETRMELRVNGVLRSSGLGTDCLGDPLLALSWLAEETLRLGSPLRAGDVVLSGSLGPLVAVEAGDQVMAELTGLGSVSARFGHVA